jgi:hypothetical protein
MRAEHVTDTLELALMASGLNQAILCKSSGSGTFAPCFSISVALRYRPDRSHF